MILNMLKIRTSESDMRQYLFCAKSIQGAVNQNPLKEHINEAKTAAAENGMPVCRIAFIPAVLLF